MAAGSKSGNHKKIRAARRTGRKTRRATLAEQADKFVCYEKAVQAPEADADFIDRSFRKHRGRPPRVLREDFCGTAALCTAWVKRHRQNMAYGIDRHRCSNIADYFDWVAVRISQDCDSTNLNCIVGISYNRTINLAKDHRLPETFIP